jgi:hypothetical protein
MEKTFVVGIGWGLGTVLGLGLLAGAVIGHQGRPKPPKPWNTTAIKAEYNTTSAEGEKIRFCLSTPWKTRPTLIIELKMRMT